MIRLRSERSRRNQSCAAHVLYIVHTTRTDRRTDDPRTNRRRTATASAHDRLRRTATASATIHDHNRNVLYPRLDDPGRETGPGITPEIEPGAVCDAQRVQERDRGLAPLQVHLFHFSSTPISIPSNRVSRFSITESFQQIIKRITKCV